MDRRPRSPAGHPMPASTRLLVFSAITALLIPPAVWAGELHIYEHNKSVIHWYVLGDRVKATYRAVRPGLRDAGVRSGAVLFEGEYQGSRMVGAAYAFKRGCKPAGYEVIGHHEGSQIILRGPAPTRSTNGCAITGYSATSPHAVLTLIYSATHH